MLEIVHIANQIAQDWWLLIGFFTAGCAWIQFKHWFKKIDAILEQSNSQHTQQSETLDNLFTKLNAIEARQLSIEEKVEQIHEELHTQDIKLAVLENSTRSRKVSSRK